MNDERLKRLRENLNKIGRENLNQIIRELNRKYESCVSSFGVVFSGMSIQEAKSTFVCGDAEYSLVA